MTTVSQEAIQRQQLVGDTYDRMVKLSHQQYPKETLKEIPNIQEGFKYARSSLGLSAVNKNFQRGFYKVRTTDFDAIKQQKCQHSQFASYVESEYLFSTNEQLKQEYCRMGGQSLRYGKIIEELDAMAADCSYKYLMKNDDAQSFDPDLRDYFLVTVSVDRVDFMGKLSANHDLKLSAYMLMAKGSTLMIKIDVLQRYDQTWDQVGDAIIVFVARNAKNNKAYKVPDMQPSNYDDLLNTMKCIELGLTIKDWSRDKSLREMHSTIPDYQESQNFNQYYSFLQTQKCTDPQSVITVNETERKTRLLMHSQDRNRHGKIFGGYLMKEAFDISWITATITYPSGIPELLRVDQVLFLKPVPVGSVLEFRSKVTLIKEIQGIGQVMRVVTKAYNDFDEQTNNFGFLFVVKNPTHKRYVLPETFEDILDYHEAQRRLEYEQLIVK